MREYRTERTEIKTDVNKDRDEFHTELREQASRYEDRVKYSTPDNHNQILKHKYFGIGNPYFMRELKNEKQFVRSLFKGPIYIGVDGGVTTGVAVWSRPEKKLLDVTSFPFWEAIEYFQTILKYTESTGLTAVIEDVTANRPVFPKKVSKTNMLVYGKVAQDVGKVKAYTTLVIEWFRANNVPIILIKPSKASLTKIDEKIFRQMTGWEQRTNEHGRDAAMYVWNK